METKEALAYISLMQDPWLNQAIEFQLFDSLKIGQRILFLYRNAPSVVIGRYQNPWLECHLEDMERDDVKLVRRISGGGAVYHDPGNLNFSFMAPKETIDRERHLETVLRALGIPNCSMNNRFDLLIDGKKISGSAFKKTREKSLHHGTLLIQADLFALEKYLSPSSTSKSRIHKALGTKSIRSKVTNVKEYLPKIEIEGFYPLLVQEFFKEFALNLFDQNKKVEELTEEKVKDLEAVKKNYAKFKDLKWGREETPRFEHFFSIERTEGIYEGDLVVEKGKIVQMAFRPWMEEGMDQSWIAETKSKLEGSSYIGATPLL